MINEQIINAILQEDCSKTKRKAAMHELQKLAEHLVTLKIAQLEQLPLDEFFYDAILEAKTLKAKEAIKRQNQYLGRLIQDEDFFEIIKVIKKKRWI